MYDREVDYNYLTDENNVKVISCSSQSKGCGAQYILNNDRKSIWLSEKPVPQTIILDLTGMIRRPKHLFKFWGVYCWHAYSTNPKLVDLQFSKDNKTYYTAGTYELALKPGTQFFEITTSSDIEGRELHFIKLIIKESYGGNRTYLNQVYFFDEFTPSLSTNTTIKPSERRKKIAKSENQSLLLSVFKEDEAGENDEIKKPVIPMKEVIKGKMSEDEESTKGGGTMLIENKTLKSNSRNKSHSSDINNFLEDSSNATAKMIRKTSEKKLKRIEKILKNKIKEKIGSRMVTADKNQWTSENYLAQDYNEEEQEKVNPLKMKIKKNKACTDEGDYERFNEKEKEQGYSKKQTYIPEDNEYLKLENQLKDMENHLKSMNADYQYQEKLFSGVLGHSKSFSFLKRDMTHNSIQSGVHVSNPFLNCERATVVGNGNNMMHLKDYLFEENNQTGEYNYPLQCPDSKNTQINMNTNNNIDNQVNQKKVTEDKVTKIEEKLNSFEKDLQELKISFQKLVENIGRLVEGDVLNQNINRNLEDNLDNFMTKNANNEQFPIGMILSECEKMINQRLNPQYSPGTNYRSNLSPMYSNENINMTKKTPVREYRSDHCNSNNLDASFENRLNRKIEEKFEALANNIESQIYHNFLKPSINTIEKTMKTNFDEIKTKINSINNESLIIRKDPREKVNLSINDSMLSSNLDFGIKSTQRQRDKNIEDKLDEINAIGERLYDKLVEKEKKLNDLKTETASYLKKKMKNDEKRYAGLK